MSIIVVTKKTEQLSKEEFLEQALKEIQEKLKGKGEQFSFDVGARQEALKRRPAR